MFPWQIEEQRSEVARHLAATARGAEGKNSLWGYFGLTKRAKERVPEVNPLEAKLDLLIQRLANQEAQKEFGEIRRPEATSRLAWNASAAEEILNVGARLRTPINLGMEDDVFIVEVAVPPTKLFLRALSEVAEEWQQRIRVTNANGVIFHTIP